MALIRFFLGISYALGSARTLVRRLGGLALMAMGVHAAADVLDDLAYDALDALDLIVDNAVASFLAWLSSAGGMTPAGAVSAIESFSALIDLEEKGYIALRVALVAELVLDFVLLDLAWGARAWAGESRLDDLKRSTAQLREVARAIDVERLLGPVVLLAFSVGGALVVGLAVEQPVRAALAAFAPGLVIAGNVAAFVAFIVAGVIMWRFVPDMVQGALVRAHERGVRAAAARRAHLEKYPPKHPRLTRVTDGIRRLLRGAWLVVALFVAAAGLLGGAAQDKGYGVHGLVDRLGAAP